MLEFYTAYKDYNFLMPFTEDLVSHIAQEALGTLNVTFDGTEIDLTPPWPRLPMLEALRDKGVPAAIKDGIWTGETALINRSGEEIPASQVIQELLPYAEAGLSSIKVDPGEIRQHLDIVDHRLTAKITGARWQLQRLEQLESDTNRNEALHKMLNEYVTRAAEGSPVHQWSH